MNVLNTVIQVLTTAVTVFTAYQIMYLIIGLFSPKIKYKYCGKKHRYAVVICARNEEKVIGKLIESIKNQTYDADKIKIFVCADSCTDGTAEICREMGCTVYERPKPHISKARKGYALEWFFDMLRADYDISKFDGFAFFDADNILAPTWFERVNDAFATDADIVTTYRNTKNFDTNFISAAYGIHFYRSTVQFHRPRQRMKLCTHIAGTGYVVKSNLLLNGWHFTELTEDTELTQHIAAEGKKIVFCEEAEFFDEQPHNFKVMFRQRLRWAKGRLAVFCKHSWCNLKGIFVQSGARKVWSNYDMFWYLFPGGLFAALLAVISFIAGMVAGIIAGTASSAVAEASGLGFYLNLLYTAAIGYLGYTVQAAIVVIRERKHIHCSVGRQILYVFTFFWFDLINLPISIVSLFMRVRWKPIVHDKAFDYSQIVNSGRK